MKKAGKSPPVTAETLSGVALFRDLSAETRAEIAARVRGHFFKAGQLIIAHKDSSDEAYFIVTGEVRATIYARTGRTVSFRDIGPGHAFGEWSAIDKQPRSSSVIALTDVFVVAMARGVFKDVITSEPEIGWSLLEQMSLLMRQLSDRVVELSTLGVKNRLHAELLRLARNDLRGDGTAIISEFPTNEEMASRISTRREAVNRELRHLESIGLIERDSEKRVVTDVEQLELMVKEAVGD